VGVLVLFGLNRARVPAVGLYVLVGLLVWLCVLKSGVHATLAGVIAALCIPARDPKHPEHPPLKVLEHALHPWVAFGIVPIFAFANAGVNLTGLSMRDLLQPIPLGILLGLVLGKQLGVFSFSWLAVKLGIARLPSGVEFKHLYGAAILCGIGFTMSLFIGMLAFENSATGEVIVTDQIGILAGTLISAFAGYLVLHFVLPKHSTPHA
jgi:NhaA family Na+:H+ antiporter